MSKIPADKIEYNNHDGFGVISLDGEVFVKEHFFMEVEVNITDCDELTIEFEEYGATIRGDMIVIVSWIEGISNGTEYTDDHIIHSIKGK